MRMNGPKEEAKMPFENEKQAVSNQLEMASMISDHNSVINTSPIRPSQVASTRGTKVKKNDK